MIGVGKYDDEATIVRERTRAVGVLVLVFGGAKGDGFSAQIPPELIFDVPRILRIVADELERSFEGRPS